MNYSEQNQEHSGSGSQSTSGEPNSAPDADLLQLVEEELGAIKTQAVAAAKFAGAAAKLGL